MRVHRHGDRRTHLHTRRELAESELRRFPCPGKGRARCTFLRGELSGRGGRPAAPPGARGEPAYPAPAQVSTKIPNAQRNKGKTRKRRFKEGNSQVLSFICGHNSPSGLLLGAAAQPGSREQAENMNRTYPSAVGKEHTRHCPGHREHTALLDKPT